MSEIERALETADYFAERMTTHGDDEPMRTRTSRRDMVLLAREVRRLTAALEKVTRERDEIVEECAKVLDAMPDMMPISEKHVRGVKPSDCATALRALKSAPTAPEAIPEGDT